MIVGKLYRAKKNIVVEESSLLNFNEEMVKVLSEGEIFMPVSIEPHSIMPEDIVYFEFLNPEGDVKKVPMALKDEHKLFEIVGRDV